MHRWILASPHQKRRNTRQLRQNCVKFTQIRCPCAHNAQRMLEQSRLLERRLVPGQSSGRNTASAGIKAGVEIWEEETHVFDPKPEQARAKIAACKRRQPPAMRRIWVYGRHKHHSPHAQVAFSTLAFRSRPINRRSRRAVPPME